MAHLNWDAAGHYYKECGSELTEWALTNEGRKLLKKSIKKYTVQVLPNEKGYLHVDHKGEDSDEVSYSLGWPTEFTKSEIEELKTRDDIAIDWDKVEIEEEDSYYLTQADDE